MLATVESYDAVHVIGTVTEHIAVKAPSCVVTVITAMPLEIAVILPVSSTVATAVLLDDQLTTLFVASSGEIMAAIESVLPADISREVLLSETPVTGTVTVTLQLAEKPPSCVVTLIVAVPPAIAVILPYAPKIL